MAENRTRRTFVHVTRIVALAACVASVLGTRAVARSIVRGVDFVNPVLGYGIAEQNEQLAKLKAAGIRVVRFGVEGDVGKNVDFIERAHAQGISCVLILHGQYAANAPVRPYRPKDFPGMWGGSPLSALDLGLSRTYFENLSDRLDAQRLRLAGLEFENEINMAGYDPDFRLPGEGRVLGLADLANDPEGRDVAKGFVRYLKVLAELKDVRDRSSANRGIPLLPSSLVAIVDEGPWSTPKKYDGVSVGATMAFWRAHGLDDLVDAYNLHLYPWADGPGRAASATHRSRALQQLVGPVCSAVGSSTGKPCWITEWGFTNDSRACPPSERDRSLLVREMMGDFRPLAARNVLTGLIYYAWVGETKFDVYRCGELTESGRSAIAPL